MTQPADARPGGTLPQAGSAAPDRRWLILGVIALAQLMIVASSTIMSWARAITPRISHRWSGAAGLAWGGVPPGRASAGWVMTWPS